MRSSKARMPTRRRLHRRDVDRDPGGRMPGGDRGRSARAAHRLGVFGSCIRHGDSPTRRGGTARRRRTLRARLSGGGRADAARLSEAGRRLRGSSRRRPARAARRRGRMRAWQRPPRSAEHRRQLAKCWPRALHAAHEKARGKERDAAPYRGRGERRGARRRCRRASLVDWLRDELRLTGTHVGCEHGVCGACSVMLDGEAVRACLMSPCRPRSRVTTVEAWRPTAA